MAWLFPRVYDRLIAATEEACLQAWRAELLADVSGEVVELGAGTGANLAHYGPGVTRLVLTDPEPLMLDRLQRKLGAGATRSMSPSAAIDVVEADAADLAFGDASFDVAVCTLVLCSVPDPERTLAEIRRVLRPGGRLVFLEHVLAEDRPRRSRWQHRMTPVWKRVAGGCHLDRPTEATIAAAGLAVRSSRRESMRNALPIMRPTVRGSAVSPAVGPAVSPPA